MSSHAKASTAGTTQRQATGLGRIFRGAAATRASSFGRNGRGTSSGRLGALGLAMAVAAALLALFAASASAIGIHEEEEFSPLAPPTGVTLHELNGLALDEATGNVFVTDAEGGVVGQVAIFGAEGGDPVELEPPFRLSAGLQFDINTSYALAFDNAAPSSKLGTLYVYDWVTEKLREYRRDGLSEQYVWENEAEGEGPKLPPGAGSQSTGGSVDDDGNVWVGAAHASAIFKVTPAGVVSEFPLNPEENLNDPLSTPGQTAVDSAGDVFVTQGSTGLYKCVPNEAGEITRAGCSPGLPVVSGNARGVAVDRSHNRLYVALSSGGAESGARIEEFDIATMKKVTPSFAKGVHLAQIAVNEESGRIYAAEPGPILGGNGQVRVYGPVVTVPTVNATAATGVTGTKATLNGTVNPEGIAVEECFFEWGSTASYGHKEACEGALGSGSEPLPVELKLSGLTPNGATYHYKLFAKNENGLSESADKTLTTSSTVTTEAATAIGPEAATLHGTVRPEGSEVLDCAFEWKLATDASFQNSPCDPDAAELEPDFTAHAVKADLSGLDANGTYVFRLKFTVQEGLEEATRYGATLSFTTTGPPQISEVRAVGATENSVTLEAKIDPSGFQTGYRFEWGPTGAYGSRYPALSDEQIGSGTAPIRVFVNVPSLAAASTYHYRVVASSFAQGTSTSGDRSFETLNSCGLVAGRCLELASPMDLGLLGAPLRFTGQREIHYQASTQPGAVAYSIEAGTADATRGNEVLYKSTRSLGDGWGAAQLGPGADAPNEYDGNAALPAEFAALSPDLSCGVLRSNQPLTGDPQARLVVEAGGSNLYRRNPDGSYDLITNLGPENLDDINAESGNYTLNGMSEDCGRILFTSDLHYPGLGGAGETRLYEWESGSLRLAGKVPSGGGEEAAAEDAVGGTDNNHFNVVSDDGSRAFLSAPRATGKAGEVGETGVFVREGGHSYDLSTSKTSTPNEGSKYVGATPDGSRVYFTANAGLTEETSESGTDLYECRIAEDEAGELECGELVDLSPAPEGAANVYGLVGLADDGSHVYFAARAQLVPGRGPTTTQNQTANTYSIYNTSEGELAYAGTVTLSDIQSPPRTTTAQQSSWSSRVSASGRFLLFESRANVTGYESGGAAQAYLYDAAAAREAIKCLSCRTDGKPTEFDLEYPLETPAASNELYAPASLVVRDGSPRAFFVSQEALATGATQGELNLYEWANDQVTWIATEPGVGVGAGGGVNQRKIRFLGASEDGTDVYFADAKALNWENPEGRYAVWDARIGGGFPEPAQPSNCDPTSEGSCQGSGSGSPSSPSAASKGFHGEGNVEEPGNAANRCTGKARQAKRLSARAKKLRRNARKLARNGKHARAAKLNRKAKGLARKARGQSNQAKRCRRRLRAGNDGRAGK